MGLRTKATLGPRGGEFLPLGGGFVIASPFTIKGDHPDLPYVIDMTVALDDDGRLVCQQLTATRRGDGTPVSAAGLRRLPIAQIIRHFAWQHMHRAERMGETVTKITPLRPPPEGLRDNGPSIEALELVAVVYRLAMAMGDPPKRSVADQLELPMSTAGRWITAARGKGLLGAATPSRAGAALPPLSTGDELVRWGEDDQDDD